MATINSLIDKIIGPTSDKSFQTIDLQNARASKNRQARLEGERPIGGADWRTEMKKTPPTNKGA